MASEIKDCPCTLFLTERAAPITPGYYWAMPGDGEQIVPIRVIRLPGLREERLVGQDVDSSYYELSWFRWFGALPTVMEASRG